MTKVKRQDQIIDIPDNQVQAGDEVMTEQPDEVMTEQPVANLEQVVVFAKSRFGVAKPEGGNHIIEAGESIVPKWVAEHWYAKAQGLRIIGKVQEDSIQSALSIKKLEIIGRAVNELVSTINSLSGITDLTDNQKVQLDSLNTSAKSIQTAFSDFNT